MQIIIKTKRRGGKTTLLVEYVLNALENCTNKNVLICASTRSGVVDLCDMIIDTAMKKEGYLKEPVTDGKSYAYINGNRLTKLALYGDVDRISRGQLVDVIAIDNFDYLHEKAVEFIEMVYLTSHAGKDVLMLKTETEGPR
jgi:hypothetical protein